MRGNKPTPQNIQNIIKLRSKGSSFSEISLSLSIPQTTVYKYAYQTKIEDKYLSLWKSKRGGSSKTKLRKILHYERWANSIFQTTLTDREKILFLSAIYWGEGSKRDLEIINSDANLLSVFIKLLRQHFQLGNDRLFAYLRIFPGVDKKESITYWSKYLDLPSANFTGFELVEGKKIGKLPYGMCRLRIRKGADILKQIKAINKTVSKIV